MTKHVLTLVLGACAVSAFSIAQAAPPDVKPGPSTPVTVVNTTANPVPVSGNVSVSGIGGPVLVTPPLWQGTPAIFGGLLANESFDGAEVCPSIYTAGAGEAFLLKTVTGRYNVPPGNSGSMGLLVKVFGTTSEVRLDVSMYPEAPARQVAGLYDQYAGSLDGGGIPIISAKACLAGITSRGGLHIIGFVVTP